MPPVGFEPVIPANERPQTYALDSAATGVDITNSKVGGFFELENIVRKRNR
jgi:hypothetical protein